MIDDPAAHFLEAVGKILDLALHQDDAADASQQAVERADRSPSVTLASIRAKYRRRPSSSASAPSILASV